MSTIEEQLSEELRDAIKARDPLRRDAVRQVLTEAARERSAAGSTGEGGDQLYQRVIASYVKTMDKSRSEYEEMGERGEEMAEKLRFEVEYLSRWLPEKRSEADTRALVADAIEELGVGGDEKAAGRVTGHLMREHGDELDGRMVNRLVREQLAGG